MYAIRTILFPTDFSECSMPALTVSSSLARDHGARLVILHVLELAAVAGESGMILPAPPVTWEEAEARLQQLSPPDPGIPVERHLVEGLVVDKILELAEATHCDLIVMGTHGRKGLSRFLMGSVAELVMRRARCPVLTVRGPLPASDAPHATEPMPEPAAMP